MDPAQREQLQLAMTALAAGDRSAFHPVFAGLWPLVLRLCQSTLRDPDVAEDAAQAALMKLFLHAAEFRADGDAVARREYEDVALDRGVADGSPTLTWEGMTASSVQILQRPSVGASTGACARAR